MTSTAKNKDVQKWYQQTGWIIALLILFFPVGLYLMWKYAKWNNLVKIAISVFFILVMFSPSDKSDSSSTTINGQENVKEEIEAIPEEIESVIEPFEVEADEATPTSTPEPTPTPTTPPQPTQKPTPTPASSIPTPRPTVKPTPPAPAKTPSAPPETSGLPLKAICEDGSTSYQDDASKPDYRGMCSGHGGIETKLGRMP